MIDIKMNKFIPKTGKNGLLIYAAAIWAFGGFMLLKNGNHYLPGDITHRSVKIFVAVLAGLIFYLGMFRKISKKYIDRMNEIGKNKVPIFMAFEKRSYFILALMITMGISFRLSGLIPIVYLSLFYYTMGIPLIISSVRYIINTKKEI